LEIAFLPYRILNAFRIREEFQYHWNVFISNMLVLVLFLSSGIWFVHTGRLPHFCLFHQLTGIPCPFCGITSGLTCLFHGDFVPAWEANRGTFFLLLYFVFQIIFRIILLLKQQPLCSSIEKISKRSSMVLLGIIFVNWIYNIYTLYLLNIS